MEDDALQITHKTKEKLELAPTIDVVWSDFTAFLERYKKGKDNWSSPIPGGYNIVNYDSIIVNRLCLQYGPYDSKYCSQKIFHPIHTVDLMHDFWRWTYSDKINNNNSLSLDSIREWLGMSKDGAHDALNDVLDCAEIMKRFIDKYNTFYRKTKFAGALSSWQRPTVKVVTNGTNNI